MVHRSLYLLVCCALTRHIHAKNRPAGVKRQATSASEKAVDTEVSASLANMSFKRDDPKLYTREFGSASKEG